MVHIAHCTLKPTHARPPLASLPPQWSDLNPWYVCPDRGEIVHTLHNVHTVLIAVAHCSVEPLALLHFWLQEVIDFPVLLEFWRVKTMCFPFELSKGILSLITITLQLSVEQCGEIGGNVERCGLQCGKV